MIGALVLRPNRIPSIAPGQDQRLPHSERLFELRVGELLDLLRVLEPAFVSGRSVRRVVNERVEQSFALQFIKSGLKQRTEHSYFFGLRVGSVLNVMSDELESVNWR